MSEDNKSDAWQHEQQKFRHRMNELEADQHLFLRNNSSTVWLAHADFNPFEGDYEVAPYLMLNLCTAHVGRFRRFGIDDIRLEGTLRPGSVALALPNTEASGFWPRTQMLGIAVDLNHINLLDEKTVSAEDLIPASTHLHRDELVTSVITALWRDAEVHGLSTPFFEHGLNIILRRLLEFEGNVTKNIQRTVRPLSGARLERVLDFLESRIATDLRVSELADLAEQDVRTFTRAFRMATGYAPYEYLTFRRMENAKHYLLSGVTVTETAFLTGYSNPSKFSAAFRRLSGCSPSEWKRRQ